MDNLDNELNELLVETFNVIQKIEDRELQKLEKADLSISGFHMLEAIAKDGGQSTVSSLAARLDISLPSVTVAVSKLEKKGYVEKVRSDEDARSASIALTDKGKEVNKYHEDFHRHMIGQITKQLDEDEKNILHKTIAKLNRYFRIISS